MTTPRPSSATACARRPDSGHEPASARAEVCGRPDARRQGAPGAGAFCRGRGATGAGLAQACRDSHRECESGLGRNRSEASTRSWRRRTDSRRRRARRRSFGWSRRRTRSAPSVRARSTRSWSSDGGAGQRVFTLSTADRPYRMFVENMHDGAATLSSSGLILFANRRLAELLACSQRGDRGRRCRSSWPPAFRGIGGDARSRRAGRRASSSSSSTPTASPCPSWSAASPLEVDGDHLTCLTLHRPQRPEGPGL